MLKVYFRDVMYLSAFIVLAVGISHPRLKRSTSFGAGVLLICIIMLPLIDIIKDIVWNIFKQIKVVFNVKNSDIISFDTIFKRESSMR